MILFHSKATSVFLFFSIRIGRTNVKVVMNANITDEYRFIFAQSQNKEKQRFETLELRKICRSK